MPRTLLSALAVLSALGCSHTPQVESDRALDQHLGTIRAFEEQRVRSQTFPDITPQDVEVTPERFTHMVSIQDEGFSIDSAVPETRLQRIEYREIASVEVSWDPVGLVVPFGTLGILGPHWYTAWIELEGGRRIFLGRSRSAREVFPMWMNPEHYLSAQIEEQVESFEFVRRLANGAPPAED